jgi:hypothetical protein
MSEAPTPGAAAEAEEVSLAQPALAVPKARGRRALVVPGEQQAPAEPEGGRAAAA